MSNDTIIQSDDIGWNGSAPPIRPSVLHSRRFESPAGGTREPVALGRYYPRNPGTLRDAVTSTLDAVQVGDTNRLAPAYLVPHAALPVSGGTAAHVYARLRRHADSIDRIVLLGPIHDPESAATGCVVPHAETWSTPLGPIAIDTELVHMLVMDGHAYADDAPHAGEYCLEIQLPFLRVAVPRARVVPMLVGPATPEDVLVTLSAITEPGVRTVVIGTTGLGETEMVGRTLLSILEMAPERITPRDACGVHALRGLISWANHCRLRAELLARDGSHIACSFDEVVPRRGVPTQR